VVVHGWVYGLHNGLLEDLQMTVRDAAEVQVAYKRSLQALASRRCADPGQTPPPAA
jgi:carbonic anhydrase